MKKRVILYILLGGLLIGGGVAYYMWNRPHPKAEDQKGIALTAPALYHEFTANEPAANARYLQKVIEVSGTVSELDTNQDGKLALLLDAGEPDAVVMCTMREKGVEARTGSQVTVKGFCSGLVISEVNLTDCIIQK